MTPSTTSTKLAPTPWAKALELRPELRSGELSLAEFAADLHQVAIGAGDAVYRDPGQFFALTFPTIAMRDLAREVGLRLAGQSPRAVRLLARTYGGGKTHTLTALYHLFHQPQSLPDLPAVAEFRQHVGIPLPQARIATLCFDKLDVEKGMEVVSPTGERRWLRQPWSVIAFQLAGGEGLAQLHKDGLEQERDTPPAEPLLAQLLAGPTLVLIDEALMYARSAAAVDPAGLGRLQDFFQCLTQAAARARSCAIVASLLATDPAKSDELGRRTLEALYAVFNRELESEIQPVQKGDIAEVLRRRLFQPLSADQRERFRPPVQAAVAGAAALDDATARDRAAAEARYFDSYPFHPDLIEVFYAKWTNIAGFQQTRGVLRSFAMALRGAAAWDQSPVAGVEVFLQPPNEAGLSQAARELARIASQDVHEGAAPNWTAILEQELAKARQIQAALHGVGQREIEQAVVAAFLHSQPVGQRAPNRDLLLLLGAGAPDRIELFKGLRQWVEESWFLDETDSSAVDDKDHLPRAWRLGFRPNLRHMHHDALGRVARELIAQRLDDEIRKQSLLTKEAREAGAEVHKLPPHPSDVNDDGAFHYALLGPEAASVPGKPSPLASRFFNETTTPDKPRRFRNALLLAVPSQSRLEAARADIRAFLAWQLVHRQLAAEQAGIDPVRLQLLEVNTANAERLIASSVVQAYSIFVAVSRDDRLDAVELKSGEGPLFARICADPRSRIVTEAIAMGTLLPGGPYQLWQPGDPSRRVQDLAEAFALNPKLPKLPGAGVIRQTLVEGCLRGEIVLRLVRSDKSERTFWRQHPDEVALAERSLEVVLPGKATLTGLAPELLARGAAPELWDGDTLSFAALQAYFSGSHRVNVKLAGDHAEMMAIPAASTQVLEAAVEAAVRQRLLWLLQGPVSLYGEAVPLGVLAPAAEMRCPPAPVASTAILPASLPEAWGDGTATTAAAIAAALSARAGMPLPWPVVADAIDGALAARLLQLGPGAAWPAGPGAAGQVALAIAEEAPFPPPHQPAAKPGALVASARLQASQIQDLADNIAELVKLGATSDLAFRLQVELGGETPPSREQLDRINALLAAINPELKLK